MRYYSVGKISRTVFILKRDEKTVYLSFSHVMGRYEIDSYETEKDKDCFVSPVLARFDKFELLPEDTYQFEHNNLFAATSALSAGGQIKDFKHVYIKTNEGFYFLTSEKAGVKCLFPRGIPKLSPVRLILKMV
jgi:hypothetical protein